VAEKLMNQHDVAERLGISPKTVGDWLRAGKLKGLKVGRFWRVREEDLQEFLKQAEQD